MKAGGFRSGTKARLPQSVILRGLTTELFVTTGTFWHYRMRCRYRDDGSLVMVESLWRAVSRRVGEKIRLSVDKLRPLPANSGAVDDVTIRRVHGVGLRPSVFFGFGPFTAAC